MEPFDALSSSRQEFAGRLRLLTDGDWDRPTPCTEWDVRALVNHVVGGCTRYTMLLHGATPDETNALRALDHLGEDPVASFRAAADKMTAAFDEPDALARTVHHPAGDLPGTVLLGMRVIEFSVHSWDLSRAIGIDEQLDGGLVEWCWGMLSGMGESLAQSGFFQPPSGDVPDDAPLQDRLLHLTGRTL